MSVGIVTRVDNKASVRLLAGASDEPAARPAARAGASVGARAGDGGSSVIV